jgi:predicted Zn-dependent protease
MVYNTAQEDVKMKKYLRITSLILVIIATVILVRCAVNPVTGKKEIMLISQGQEINMGKSVDRGIRMEYGLYHDPQLSAYVEHLGRKLVPYSHRPQLQYHFAILDTPVENAFAAPGGYIYVTRGLLALVNSEAELATVLGHELGHVAARHSARQMTRSILFTLGIALASELSKDFRKIAPISWIAGQLLFLKYSRKDELQSDSLGLEYAIKAGYNSERMIDFFNSLQRITTSHGGSKIPNFLSTHPVTTKRIDKIKEHLQTEEYADAMQKSRLTVARNNYLSRIDGLIYGKNPRQGYVEQGVFYHPDMSFSFRVPYGWKLTNTARQVTMTPKGGKAVIILQAENTSEALDSYAKKMMKDFTTPQIHNQGFNVVNGFNSFYTYLTTYTEEKKEDEEKDSREKLNVNISCIRKGSTVFSFFSASSAKDFYAYEQAIGNTVYSFRRLNDPRHLNRKPQRLYIRRARQGQTLKSFLQQHQVPGNYWKQISMINAIATEQPLSAGQLIKIIK